MPGYPALVRVLMELTALPWEPVSVFVSLAFSLAGALAFYRLMRVVLPSSTALFSVVLLCVAPLSPILQVSYAESMAAFLLTVGAVPAAAAAVPRDDPGHRGAGADPTERPCRSPSPCCCTRSTAG